MRRNPAVTLTDEHRRRLDEVVLAYLRIRSKGGCSTRASEIDSSSISRVLFSFPAAKAAHRYLAESRQRLKRAGKIELVRGGWRTTSPTA